MKHSEVRNRIIETASTLFYEKGYNSTGINEIIAESGIAKATLYSHFKSKEDICLAYLQFKDAVFIKDIEAFALSKPKGLDQVLAVFGFLKLYFKDKDFNGCWCLKTVAEIPKDNDRVRNEIQAQKRGLIKLIETLILSNLEVEAEQAGSLARKVYLLYESAIGESHLHKEDWPIIEAQELCAQLFKAF
ncbi:MAG: TetR/AcrR family transcriptional regulator [Bacteroidota bacterium]